ncbi:unnamed protein product [Periconia digitata]|uniref:Uncharacterized protein n=1 Tax=Periconia digitata TaxID=1303443 RepID=A0A9W4XN85_9PLEO|nr:unnamed protein product [Periconia digitata]
MTMADAGQLGHLFYIYNPSFSLPLKSKLKGFTIAVIRFPVQNMFWLFFAINLYAIAA